MAVATQSVTELCRAAKAAARALATLDSGTKDRALLAVAEALEARMAEILDANARDLEAGRESGLSDALMDRLALTEERVRGMARGVREIAALPDPVGEVIDGYRLPNGLDVRKVRVPLGVVAVVYEARPNVTIDAAALCLKSGNAILLRGSSSATHSNAVLAAIAAEAAEGAGLPAGALGLVAGGGREELAELAGQEGLVDLIIPRGGEGLKKALSAVAKVPVIYAASGNCHVYVDASADLARAVEIVVNAKTQRPGTCNSAETLLVHAGAAGAFLPGALRALAAAGVELRGDERTRALAPEGVAVAAATDEDYATEFLALVLAVKVVDSVEEAIEHVSTFGSGHSEAILTGSTAAARAFQLGVDAACVYVNASTRFTDGGEFGMGAEIGNSTQKLHARGPIGLRELCTFKYLVEGDGHLRRRPADGSASSAGRSTRRTSGTWSARRRRSGLRAGPRAARAGGRTAAQGGRGDPGAQERVAMCEAAVAGDERLGVSRADVDRDGPPYTVELLRALRAAAPGRRALLHRRRRHGALPADLAGARGGARAGPARGGRARGPGARRHRGAPRGAARRRGARRVLLDAADRRLQLADPARGRPPACRSATSCPTRWRRTSSAGRPVRRLS